MICQAGNSLNLAVTAFVGQHSPVTVHSYPLIIHWSEFWAEAVSLLDVM